MHTAFSWEAFRAVPLIAILRNFTVDETSHLVDAACRGGITTLEVTMGSVDIEKQLEAARAAAGPSVNVGVGTVCCPTDLDRACEAGGSFIVTPALSLEVLDGCARRELPVFCGAFTPTEILTAHSHGAAMVKLFPASIGGPQYLKELRGPFPDISFVPTGGIDLQNINAFLQAGAAAFGLGSALFDRERVRARDWAWVTDQAAKFVAAVAK